MLEWETCQGSRQEYNTQKNIEAAMNLAFSLPLDMLLSVFNISGFLIVCILVDYYFAF